MPRTRLDATSAASARLRIVLFTVFLPLVEGFGGGPLSAGRGGASPFGRGEVAGLRRPRRRIAGVCVRPDALLCPLRVEREEARGQLVGQRVVAPEQVEPLCARGVFLA